MQKGMSKFEFVVAISIICSLIATFLYKMDATLAAIEQVVIKQIVNSLNQSLALEVLHSRMTPTNLQLLPYTCINPMDFLSVKPPNYRGILADTEPKFVHLGNWYFDQTHCQLIYQVQHGTQSELRYVVIKTYAPDIANGKSVLQHLRLDRIN